MRTGLADKITNFKYIIDTEKDQTIWMGPSETDGVVAEASP